jgi:DNA modification methylase
MEDIKMANTNQKKTAGRPPKAVENKEVISSEIEGQIKDVPSTIEKKIEEVKTSKKEVKTYSDEGMTVLDFTMGAGASMVASKNLNRKFIGIEKEANYYEIACRRCCF